MKDILKQLLSIPFIGIFALHLNEIANPKNSWMVTFNSLYWDFCSASTCYFLAGYLKGAAFQFPLLGFLLCISSGTV